MSIFDDSRLQGYQRELKKLIEDQSRYSSELTRLRTKMEAELEGITRSYKREIESAQRELDATTRSIPDSQRQIERRQEELNRELKANAAKADQKK